MEKEKQSDMLNLLSLSPNLESELRSSGSEIRVTTHGRMSSKAIPTPWEATPPWEMCADCRAKELRVRFLFIHFIWDRDELGRY